MMQSLSEQATTAWRFPRIWARVDGGAGAGEDDWRRAGALHRALYPAGFLHNLHSNYHTFVGLCPVYDDLDLVGEPDGVSYAFPPVQMGSIFEDGTAMTIHTDMEKTHASMSRFSKKDADTFSGSTKRSKGFRIL